MPVNLSYIRAFLNRPGMEGPQQMRGYIPCFWEPSGAGASSPRRTRNYTGQAHPEEYTAMGVSGVTIATGVDFGQTDAQELRAHGVPESIVNSLRPYLGLRQAAAIRKLHAVPLYISQDTADALDDAVHGLHARRIGQFYDQARPLTPFADLPPQAQAAIFSIFYQRGTGYAARMPVTWSALRRGDWQAAAKELCDRSAWKDYQNRRALEGALLKEMA